MPTRPMRQLADQMAESYYDKHSATCRTMSALVRRSLVQLSGNPSINRRPDKMGPGEVSVAVLSQESPDWRRQPIARRCSKLRLGMIRAEPLPGDSQSVSTERD